MSVNSIPQPAQPIAGALPVDATWYRWLRELDRVARANGADVSAEIEALARRLGSPDGSIAGIPDGGGSLIGISPITVAGNNVRLQASPLATGGALQGVTVDEFGRVIEARPVVAGAGVVIDGTTNPAQVEIRATAQSVQRTRITSAGDFRRSTQDDLRVTT